jgi:type II secretory pathway predicted ATPase ExeA
MGALSHFHFDRDPFPIAGPNNYTYENRRQTRAIEDMCAMMRAHPGLYILAGAEGTGKSSVLKRVLARLGNNDFAVLAQAGAGRCDIMRDLAEGLGLAGRKKPDDGDVLGALDKLHKRGMNAILIVDDAEELPEAQRAVLASLMASLPFLRALLSGGDGMKRMLKGKAMASTRGRIVRRYRLRPLSFIEGIAYVNRLAVDALSLSQYKKAIGFWTAAGISFAANRNMKNVNLIATRAIEDAHREGLPSVRARNAFHAVRANFSAVRENIYLKFQKIFLGLVALFCAGYAAKMLIDRNALIDEIEVHKSLAEQEKLIQAIEIEEGK